jgi:hypothetical protein
MQYFHQGGWAAGASESLQNPNPNPNFLTLTAEYDFEIDAINHTTCSCLQIGPRAMQSRNGRMF